jgi:SAM-dependent methyltransferase
MRSTTVERLRCVKCGGPGLRLDGQLVGDRVLEGAVVCSCGNRAPIHDGVLDLRPHAPEGVRADGEWWGAFFREQAAAGYGGFFDLDGAVAPFLHLGLAEAFPESRPDGLPERRANFSGMMGALAEGPGWALDVGTGSGWAATFLARRGFQVIALDPAWDAVVAGARFARENSLCVDYICAGVTELQLAPACLDLVVSCHTLHHVPQLEEAMGRLFAWLRVDGRIFVDDHHASHPALYTYYRTLEKFIARELIPRGASRSVTGYHSGASANEDISLGQTLPALCRYFEPTALSTRPVLLDTMPFLVYMRNNRSVEAYRAVQQAMAILGELFTEALPWTVEYITFAGRRGPHPARQSSPLAHPGPPPVAGQPNIYAPIHERRIAELWHLQRQLLWTYAHKTRRWFVRLLEKWRDKKRML